MSQKPIPLAKLGKNIRIDYRSARYVRAYEYGFQYLLEDYKVPHSWAESISRRSPRWILNALGRWTTTRKAMETSYQKHYEWVDKEIDKLVESMGDSAATDSQE